MNMKQAKKEIIKAYSDLLGFEMAASTQIEAYLTIGVKLGKITPKSAAQIHKKEYEKACTQAMER